MRSGKLCALQKTDLYFKTNMICINSTLYSKSNNMREYELPPPKTDGSIRFIEVEKPIMDMFRLVVRGNDKHKL